MSSVCTGRKVMSGVKLEVVDYSKMEDDGGISININLFLGGWGLRSYTKRAMTIH